MLNSYVECKDANLWRLDMLLYASLSVADGLGKGFVVPTARTYLVRLQRFSAVQNPLNGLFLTHLIRTWKEKKKKTL